MMMFLSRHFTFDCQHQMKRNVIKFDDTSVNEQYVSQMATHQIRFDDGIFFHVTLDDVIKSWQSIRRQSNIKDLPAIQ